MAVCNNSVQPNLVQVGRLKLQHLVNTSPVDLVGSLLDLWFRTISTAESSVDQILGVFIEEVESGQMSTAGNLDQLSEPVSGLSDWQSSEEAEIEEGVHRSVVGAQAILVVAIVDGDLDGDRGINQANHGGWDTDVVGVSSVGCTSKSVNC